MNNRSKKAYNHLNDFYKKIFGERVLKIPLDGGFTCPNRDGTKGFGNGRGHLHRRWHTWQAHS